MATKTFRKVPREKIDSPERTKGYLPSIHFNSQQLAEIKGWDVGQDYQIVMKMRMTSKNMREGDPQISGSFDIKALKVLNKSSDNPHPRQMSNEELDKRLKSQKLIPHKSKRY